MTTALILGTVLLLSPQDQPAKTFNFAATNLKFQHAANWQIRKVKDDFRITIPVKDGQNATLELFAVSFMAAPEVWEDAQKFFAEQQRLRILRQQREELLSVPLLLFRLQETATPDRKITLSGLVYAATEFKMQFRLTAPEAIFPDAEFIWREALQSMGTIDGRLPKAEQPGRATEAPASKRRRLEAPNREIQRLESGGTTSAAKIEQVTVEATVANQKVVLGTPKGWTLTPKEDGTIHAAHPELEGAAVLRLSSTLEGPTAQRQLSDRASATLADFVAVARRAETSPRVNAAGARASRLIREGDDAKGPRALFLASGEKGTLTWLLEYSFAGKLSKAAESLLDTLVAGTSVEPAP